MKPRFDNVIYKASNRLSNKYNKLDSHQRLDVRLSTWYLREYFEIPCYGNPQNKIMRVLLGYDEFKDKDTLFIGSYSNRRLDDILKYYIGAFKMIKFLNKEFRRYKV
jgi:hypothetical protein